MKKTALPCSLVLPALLGLAGCGSKGGGGGSTAPSGPTPADYIYLAKNWSFVATPTKGGPAGTYRVGGVIDEQPGSNSSHYVTSVLQIAAPCFAGADVVPMDGSVNGPRVQMSSFSVNGQIFSIDAQKDSTSTQLSGVYSVLGGCANGEAGTLSGQAYAALSGRYAGTVSGQPGKSIVLSVNQEALGTGLGTFVVSGTAAFSGFTCFTQGSAVADNAYVRGNTVVLQFSANDASQSQVTLSGTIDPAAKTLSVTSANVVGGSCSGSLGAITFGKQ